MNKQTKTLFLLLGSAIVIAIVYFAMMYSSPTSSDMATTTDMTATTSVSTSTSKKAPVKTTVRTTPAAQTTATPMEFTWRFVGKGSDQVTTDVTVVADGKEHLLGEFIGKCETIAAADLKGANEVSGVLCLVDDKGTEIGVFRSGSKYLVQKGDIVIGDTQNPGKRGPFVTILTLP